MKSGKRKPNYKNIFFIVVLALAFVATLLCTLKFKDERETAFPEGDGICVVLMGDSNVAFSHFEENLEAYIAKLTGYEVYNLAMGGTTAAKIDVNNSPDEYYDKCCLYNLINLPISGELECYLDNPHIITERYEDAVYKLKVLNALDYERVDYLVLTYGTNDYFIGVPARNVSDKYDLTSYEGAMRSSIEKIHRYYPDIKIIITSQTFCYEEVNGELIPGVEYDKGGGTLKDYIDVCVRISEDYDYVYLADMYNELGIDETNYNEYMYDNLHLLGDAQKKWCELIVKQIKAIEG